MGEPVVFSDADGRLSYGGALVGVVVASWVSSLTSPLMTAFAPYFGGEAVDYGWIVVGALFAGIGLTMTFALFGFDLPFGAAVIAVLVANITAVEIPRVLYSSAEPAYGPFLGGIGLFFSVPGLFLGAWIVAASATRRWRVPESHRGELR